MAVPRAELTLETIEATRAALGARIVHTPIHRWSGDAADALVGPGSEVVFKLELLQHTGTFKVRGALNVVDQLDAATRARGITAISAGNHALAAAWVARRVGTHAKIVMINKGNSFRADRCRAMGAELIPMDDATAGFELVERITAEEGRTFVHPFEGPFTSAGTATVGLELCRDAGPLDAVIVPIGGGGLASGVAAAVKALQPRCAVYGVEPIGAPTMTRALEAGEPVPIGPMTSIADSLSAPFTAPWSFSLCQQHLDEVVLVTDDELRQAMAVAFAELKLALEPAGAAATAALLGPLRQRLAGQRVGVIVCGTNIDHATWAAHLA